MGETLSIDQFYSAGKSQRLLGLRCNKGHITAPPRHSCQVCNSSNLAVVELSGKGNVVSYTEVHSKSKEFPVGTPYVLALVKLEEGPNLLGTIQQQPKLEQAVRVKFEEKEEGGNAKGWPRITFEPA
jgi:uncharacterized OB-fold protein